MSKRIHVYALLLLCLIGYTLVLLSQDSEVLHDQQLSSAAALPASVWTSRTVAADSSSSFLSPQPRIAYVFAGSPRSFYCPKVHWSIRDYLIRGLGGDPYVFVRASSNDNRNTQTAEGSNRPLPYTQEDIERLIHQVLLPTATSWVQLGGSEEDEDMMRSFPTERHTFFRKYDRRRYSMFFHRQMAYRMVQDYEKKHGFKFDWVVMTRLDTAWVGPVLPISTYTPDRAYTPETGLFVNDQFMLIPRQYSDAVYDLDLRVQRGIFCLGGPDVPRWQCNKTELASRQVSDPEASAIVDECCSSVFGGNGHGSIGYSETILKRHLLHAEVPLAIATFPFTIFRLKNKQNMSRDDPDLCSSECFRLYKWVNNLPQFTGVASERGYRYMKDGYPSTLGRGTSVSHAMRCEALAHPKALWQPKHALDSATDTGALPVERLAVWRLRVLKDRSQCLTVHGDYITTSPCLEGDHNRRYSRNQTFLFRVNDHDSRDATYQSLSATAGDASSDALEEMSTKSARSGGDGDVGTELTSIISRSETRGLLCLTLLSNTSNSEVMTTPCDLSSPMQQWIAPKGRFGGHSFGSTVGDIRPANNPRLCIRGDQTQLDLKVGAVDAPAGNGTAATSLETSTVTVLKLKLVECKPNLLETNFDVEPVD